MSLSTLNVNAAHARVLAVDTGDAEPGSHGAADSPALWFNDGDDAVSVSADDPATILAVLDRARAAVLARFPDLAAAAAAEPCAVCGAPSTDEVRDVSADGPWFAVCGDACADKAVTHADDCDCTPCEEERATEPDGGLRTPVLLTGYAGWLDTAGRTVDAVLAAAGDRIDYADFANVSERGFVLTLTTINGEDVRAHVTQDTDAAASATWRAGGSTVQMGANDTDALVTALATTAARHLDQAGHWN